MMVAEVFHWWVVILIVFGVPLVAYALLVLSIWLSGRSWKSDS